MKITEQVQEYIANGNTAQALDLLQSFLKDKDAKLYNQTLLLESQYSEVKEKIRLNLDDADVALNRINYTILDITTEAAALEAKNAPKQTEKLPETVENTATLDPDAKKSLSIFGILVAVGVLIVIAVFMLAQGKGNKPQPATPQTMQANSTSNEIAITPLRIEPQVVTLSERYYGNFKIEVQNLQAVTKDADHNFLKMDLKMTCLQSYSGSCMANYVNFRLVLPNGDAFEPNPEIAYENPIPKDKTFIAIPISFVVKKDFKNGVLEMQYTGKPNTIVKANISY